MSNYNLSGYFLKGIPTSGLVEPARLANQIDRFLAETIPEAALFGANGNIVFMK